MRPSRRPRSARTSRIPSSRRTSRTRWGTVAGVRLTATRPVRVTGEGPVDLELHVALAAGVAAPDACRAAAGAVRGYLQSMMAIETGRITVVVEEAAGVPD